MLPDNYQQSPGCQDTCPVDPCDVPIDPSEDFVYTFLEGFLGEMTGGAPGQGLFPDEFM